MDNFGATDVDNNEDSIQQNDLQDLLDDSDEDNKLDGRLDEAQMKDLIK